MILSEIQLTEKGKHKGTPKKMQRCLIRCDKCGREFERYYFLIIDIRQKYTGEDLCRFCLWPLQKERPTFTDYNKKQAGKTIEERFGEEKASVFRKKLSNKLSGENNPNFGGKHNRWNINAQNIGKSFEERFGVEKAAKIKKKLSELNSGENNAMYGKPAPKGAGNGWSGYYKGNYFRSILELTYLKYLLDNNIQFECGERKKYAIEYEINGKKKNYFPDYYLPETNEFIEIKPYKLLGSYVNKIKFQSAIDKYGSSFKILTENELNKLDVNEIWFLYQTGEIIFDKGYGEKFEHFYNERK